MARKLKASVAQLGPIHLADTRSAVVRRLMAMMREAHAAGARFVVFPELALTTFFPRYWMTDQREIDRFFEREMPGPQTRPLFDLASELADHDEASRVALVSSFDQWEGYLIEGLTAMQTRGELRKDADPAELAVAVMTSLQGGLLLAKTRKTTQPLQIALRTAFSYVRSFASSEEEHRQ